jgi:hypothetical protein
LGKADPLTITRDRRFSWLLHLGKFNILQPGPHEINVFTLVANLDIKAFAEPLERITKFFRRNRTLALLTVNRL